MLKTLLIIAGLLMLHVCYAQKNLDGLYVGLEEKCYLLGFANQIVNNKLIVFHDVGANGISTDLDIYPALGYTVIMLSNYEHLLGWEVVKHIRTQLTN